MSDRFRTYARLDDLPSETRDDLVRAYLRVFSEPPWNESWEPEEALEKLEREVSGSGAFPTGPSCDGDDVLARGVELPEVRRGDRLCLLSTGAYSFVYRSDFCGNRQPVVGVIE